MHQDLSSHLPNTVDKIYCLLEMGANVSHVTVLHWYPFIMKLSFELFGGSAGDIEQCCDVKVMEIVLPGGMVGTPEVKKRKDFNRLALIVSCFVVSAEFLIRAGAEACGSFSSVLCGWSWLCAKFRVLGMEAFISSFKKTDFGSVAETQ